MKETDICLLRQQGIPIHPVRQWMERLPSTSAGTAPVCLQDSQLSPQGSYTFQSSQVRSTFAVLWSLAGYGPENYM